MFMSQFWGSTKYGNYASVTMATHGHLLDNKFRYKLQGGVYWASFYNFLMSQAAVKVQQ